MKEVYVLGDHPTISNFFVFNFIISSLFALVCDAHILRTSI